MSLVSLFTRRFATSVSSTSSTSSAAPVFRLNSLRDNDGAVQVKKRVGRGPASGLGKTCGKGQKGQNSRSGGGVRPGFEGGQTPLYKSQRKFGFSNEQFRIAHQPLNLGRLQYFIDCGRIDATQPITMSALVLAGVFKRNAILPHGVKLLGSGNELVQPVTIEVADASASAIAAVEKAGGRVFKVHFNKLGLRVHLGLYTHFDRPLPRYSAVPPARVARGFVHPTDTPSYKADPDHERHERFVGVINHSIDEAVREQLQQRQQKREQ